jgi:hypothetical protein
MMMTDKQPNASLEAKVRKFSIPLETQIMMCNTQEDVVLFAVAMLTKVISIFDANYDPQSRKALIEQFNK